MLLRIAVLGVTSVILGGCLPPVLQVASWTVSGASYVFSGKGVGDHVLSLAAEQDCATWRVLQGKRICVDHEKQFDNNWDAVASTFKVPAADQSGTSWDIDTETGEAVAEATLQPVEETVQVATAKIDDTSLAFEDELFFVDEADVQSNTQNSSIVMEAPKSAPALLAVAGEIGDLAPASGPSTSAAPSAASSGLVPSGAIEKEIAVPTPQEKLIVEAPAIADKPSVIFARAERRVDAKPGIYLVIGSFRSNNRAEKLQSKHAAMETAIMKASVRGSSLFRVLAGPIERTGLASARKVLSNVGVPNSWAMRLCKATLTPPPCVLPLQQASLPK